jgi:hypothetical protein
MTYYSLFHTMFENKINTYVAQFSQDHNSTSPPVHPKQPTTLDS